MGSETQRVFLTDLAADVKNAIVGGPFGSNLVSKDYVEVGVPVIRGQNMGGGKYVSGDFVYVSEEKAQKLKANLASPGDIIFTQRGTLGQVAIVPNSPWDKYVVSQSQMKATIDPKKADVEFLYYYFSSKNAIDYILANAIQTGVPHTNLTQLKEHPIDLPSIGVQKAIVGILRSLDNKVALNRQINTTLESMAQALFRSWFVDFDPVIDNALAAGNEIPDALQKRAAARAARRETLRQQSDKNTEATDAVSVEQALPDTGLSDQRLPPEIQQHFPDRFVLNEEMGWVPEGWEVKPLSEALCINPKVSIKKGTEATYVDMKALPTSGFMIDEAIKKEFSGGAKFKNRDLLLARITPCLENGKTGLVDFLSDDEAGFGSTEFIVLREKGSITMPFIAALSRHPEFRNHCVLNMVGSSGRQRVQNSCFDSYFVSTPTDSELLELFDQVCSPYFTKMAKCRDEARSLANLRDALLPKLLSGQITIPDAEQQLAEVL